MTGRVPSCAEAADPVCEVGGGSKEPDLRVAAVPQHGRRVEGFSEQFSLAVGQQGKCLGRCTALRSGLRRLIPASGTQSGPSGC